MEFPEQKPEYARWLCDIPSHGSITAYADMANCPEVTISLVAAFLFGIVIMILK